MSLEKVGPAVPVEESAGAINKVIQRVKRVRSVYSLRISFSPQRMDANSFFRPTAPLRRSIPDSDLQTPIRELVVEFSR